MSGHSKWATIKRKKGANDAARGKVFTKLIREITTAARMGGGDPDANARLRKAIADAKAQQMPGENIKRAVDRGTGDIDGVNYEEILYEGTGPGGTLFMVEGMTDNRNRTAPELRRIFEKNGGAMGATGTAGWAFERLGTIVLDKSVVDEERLMEVALEAGAEDYRDEGETWLLCMPVGDLFDVLAVFDKQGIDTLASGLSYVPNNKKEVSGSDAEKCLALAEALDDHDDVQGAFFDFNVSDEELVRILGDA
jgi:YebC/PmpR family DNA-binding regulatory protein